MTLKETKLYGLVLAGGMSVRMGQDKSIINWHGKEQRYYIADLLQQFCDEVYISCREEQQIEINPQYKTIADSVDGKGPVVGILSAQAQYPYVAWLVLACDLPLIDHVTIQHLLDNRDTTAIATTYKSPYDGLPEPLITIWEPQSHTQLNSFKEQGYNCPRKMLINSHTHIIAPQNADALQNANTPEEAAQVREILSTKTKAQ